MKKLLFLLSLTLPFQTAQAAECPATSTTVSMDLEISALYPNPNSGEAEWIELSNAGKVAVDLSLYTLEDSTGKPWTLSGTLEETLEVTGFPFQLNNSNETVTLKTLDGTTVDSFSYTTSTKGEVLTKDAPTAASPTSTSAAPVASTPTPTVTATPAQWPIFSEALPNPQGSDSTDEWIELYNPYGEELNLSGLSLDDSEGGSKPYALTGTLAAESYLLISVTESKLTLNNDTDHLRLLGVNAEILWDTVYDGSKEGLSYAWFIDFYDWTEESTPGSENTWAGEAAEEETASDETSTFQDGDLSDEVTVTEVFPNPEGPDNEEEWIEITNGGSTAVNLGNWTLDDGEGGSEPFTFPDTTVLEPGQTLILYRTETGIALNNSNETVRLSDPSGEVTSEINYESSEEDESYAEIQIEEVQSEQASTSGLGNQVLSTWQWVTPSPGALNPIWKQIKGEVMEFDGTILTVFDGVSTWSFKLASQESVDPLLYQTGNTLLVQAAAENGLFEIMHSELLESAAKESKKAFPWGILGTASLALGWGIYELNKRLQNKKAQLAI